MRCKIIGVIIVLILGGIFYTNTYNITEENIRLAVSDQIGVSENDIELIKEIEANNLKALIFRDKQRKSAIGLAVLEKGIVGKYRRPEICNGNERYITAKRYLGKTNIVIAGDNRDGRLSSIKFENSIHESVEIEQGLFVKILHVEPGEAYRYYNNNNEAVEW
ncbi:MAG: hypothetical protein ACRCW2_00390 [Cellulosilyticaceae bacterium]